MAAYTSYLKCAETGPLLTSYLSEGLVSPHLVAAVGSLLVKGLPRTASRTIRTFMCSVVTFKCDLLLCHTSGLLILCVSLCLCFVQAFSRTDILKTTLEHVQGQEESSSLRRGVRRRC